MEEETTQTEIIPQYEPKVQYLETKDGKKTPQEFAIARDLALPCIKCERRRTGFLKAAFCEPCKILWFYKGSERIGPAKKLLASDEAHGLSELELERLEWIIQYEDKPHAVKFWNDWIKDKSEKLYNEFTRLTRYSEGGTSKKVGNIDLSRIKR